MVWLSKEQAEHYLHLCDAGSFAKVFATNFLARIVCNRYLELKEVFGRVFNSVLIVALTVACTCANAH